MYHATDPCGWTAPFSTRQTFHWRSAPPGEAGDSRTHPQPSGGAGSCSRRVMPSPHPRPSD
ncbi:MAG: hypothetical protein ABGY75_05000 [Gemmataceae bacterium]